MPSLDSTPPAVNLESRLHKTRFQVTAAPPRARSREGSPRGLWGARSCWQQHGDGAAVFAGNSQGRSMSGPERQARAVARGNPQLTPQKLAKVAGLRVEVARRILEQARAERRRA